MMKVVGIMLLVLMVALLGYEVFCLVKSIKDKKKSKKGSEEE